MRCTCEDWKQGMASLEKAQCIADIHDWKYEGKTFNWCPWCSNKLIHNENATKRLRCTWCMHDVEEEICPMCGKPTFDMDAPHDHEWSRHTINSMECKRCCKVISIEDYNRLCNPHEGEPQ